MKKLITTMLTLLTCGAAYALPVGNPTEASLFLNGAWCDNNSCCDPCDPCFSWCDSWSVRIGYYGDFVFNHHFRRHNDTTGGGGIHRLHVSTNAGYVALNVCNRFDVFTTLGASDLGLEGPLRAFIPTSASYGELHYKERFSWSVGGRATLWQCDCFGIGLEGQYFQFKPELQDLVNFGAGTVTYFENEPRHTYKEWQVGLGASYRFATSCPTVAFVPYTAIKWSRARLNTNHQTFLVDADTADLGKLNSHNHWGWALGITMELCDMIGVTAEGRWGNENALYINGQFRF